MAREKEVSAAQAARRLKVALHYTYSLLWSGKLQGRKVGKQWRIPAQAVEARLKHTRGE